MSEERDIFSESIKEHLNNVDVPYNESHWNEMEQRLDQMPASDFGKSNTNVKYFVAAGVGVALIAGYFLVKQESIPVNTPNLLQESKEVIVESPKVRISVEEKSFNTETPELNIVPSESKIVQEADQVEELDKSVVDEKADKYATYSEDKIKKEGKQIVDNLVKAQKTEFKNVPNIDNAALKSDIVITSEGPFCVGEAISFTTEPTHENITYSWNFGDRGLTSREQNPTHVFKHAGTFDITVFVSRGEKNDFKATSSITIEKIPEVEMTLSTEEITLNDPYLEVSASSNELCTFHWMFNENTPAQGKEASFVVPSKQSYPIRLEALSESGCKAELTKYYHASKGVELYVETEFKPNNGLGVEEFLPRELQISDVNFIFIILDKSGNKVFESTDKYKGWNGSLNNNGNALPAGPYHWKLTFVDDRGATHKQKGKINLIN